MAHGMGSKDADNLIEFGVERVPNQISWLSANPNSGSPFNPGPYENNFSGINET